MQPSIPPSIIDILKSGRNLLAFSAGVDSTALFFLLLEAGIDFDIALVNYQTRAQSKEEEAYAYALAKRYQKRYFTMKAPPIERDFEAKARQIRYRFFEEIITKEGYDTLLTAHQLNDKMEWFLMRLAKGAGISELAGMQSIQEEKNYLLIRPLLHIAKEQLLSYLREHNHRFFVDESNSNPIYERNHFRHHFSDTLVESYAEGIARSFGYLEAEAKLLQNLYTIVEKKNHYYKVKLQEVRLASKAADAILKKEGYLLSGKERRRIEEEQSVVVGRRWAVERKGDTLHIAPYVQNVVMPKHFKEACRKAKIPPKVRGYLYTVS